MFLWSFLLFSSIAYSLGLTDQEYARLPPVFELDNFDRCLLFGDEALYCLVEYNVKPIDPEKPSLTWNHIQNLSSDPKNYRHDHLRHGICIPLSCPNISNNQQDDQLRMDLTKCMNRKYEHLGIYGTIEDAYCQTGESQKLDLFDKLVTIFLISYISFVFFASCYEGIARYRTPEKYLEMTTSGYGRIISCFSILKNWDRLKTIDWTPDNVKLKAVQGVRFYNLFLIIATHASLSLTAVPVSNTKFIETIFDKTAIVFLASGPYGVSTFFQFSALLVTYNVLKIFNEKSGKKFDLKTIFWILLYRYIRLTPSMVFILLIHSTLLIHAGQGPMYGDFIQIDRTNCRNNGWTNLLYVNNWINPSEMCLVETWYLAVDMQAFILVLIILYFTATKPKRFWWVLFGVWTVNHLFVAWHLYRKSIFHYLKPYPEKLYQIRGLYENDGIKVNTLDHTPMNLASTLIGTGLGFVMHKFEKWDIFSSKTGSLLTWLGVYAVCLAIVVIPGKWIYSPDYYDSYWFSIPYLTLGSTIYCLAIAVAAMGVISKSGWITKWILEWPPLYYLGRLSYSSYLAHYTLTVYFSASHKTLVSVDQLNMMLEGAKLFSMSLLLGLVLALVVEFPISALSGLLIKQKMIDRNEKHVLKNKTN